MGSRCRVAEITFERARIARGTEAPSGGMRQNIGGALQRSTRTALEVATAGHAGMYACLHKSLVAIVVTNLISGTIAYCT